MQVKKPDPFNLRMEIKVHSKNNGDRIGWNRKKEIEEKINKMAGFNFCNFVTQTIQPRSDEPECVTFLARTKIQNFDLFVEQLKTELGINVQYRWEFEN